MLPARAPAAATCVRSLARHATAVTLLAVEPDLGDVADEHEELLAALISGDLAAACQLTRDHQWHYAPTLLHDAHGGARD